MNVLDIRNLTVQVDEKIVINNLNFSISNDEFHALMGKNGAGKSSIAKTIVGHPDYKITSGSIIFNGTEITNMQVNERAKFGIFLAFQNPIEVPGVSVANFIRSAMNALDKKMSTTDFYKLLYENMDKVGLDRKFSSRAINVGFSGGEKKRCEILQLLMLQPSFIILDEIDSGLDMDALKLISNCINSLRGNNFSGIIITHYRRLLELISPEKVHIFENGNITNSGEIEIIDNLENKGYDFFEKDINNE